MGVALLACSEPPALPVTWHGAQIEQTPHGQRLRFTARRPPRIRVASPVSALQLELRRASQVHMIPLRFDRLDSLPIWIADPPAIPPGPAALVLHADGHAPTRIPIEWGAAPTEAVAPEAIASQPLAMQSSAWHEAARAHMRRGDLAAAADAWVAAANAADAAGQLSETARFRRAAVHQLIALGRIPDATRQLKLAEARSTAVGDVYGRALAAQYRARLARLRGDARQAERHYHAAAQLAAQAGARALFDKVRILGAVELQYAGQHAQAIARLQAIAAEPVDRNAATTALLRSNEAWIQLRAAAQGAAPLPAGLADRLRSVRDHRLEKGQITAAANLEDNLAMLHLLRGDLAAARAQLDARRARGVPGNDPWFSELLDAHIALAAHDHDHAQRAFDRVASVPTAPPEYRWRAAFGLGQAALARADRDAARAHFAKALAGLAAQARMTPIDTSRAAFFADHRTLVEAAFALAVDDGRLTDAFAIVDTDRARITGALDLGQHLQRMDPQARMAFLQARARFERDRRAGDLEADPAAWAATRAQAAIALRRRFDGLMAAATIPDPQVDLSTLAPDERIVSAWRQGAYTHVLLASATRVTLDPDWPTALPGRGHLYVVDSPHAEALTHQAPAGWTVSRIPYAGWINAPTGAAEAVPVVLGDPDGTLPAAHAEARDVAHALHVTPLTRADAEPSALLARVDGARIFHFAGHGVLTARDPFDAHLRLADRTRLGLADVLIARPRLGLVVLSGCETGARGALAGEHAIGLAQAFLVAGADRVLAAQTPVPDQQTRAFMQAFYAAGGSADPAKALAVAQPADGPWRLWGRR